VALSADRRRGLVILACSACADEVQLLGISCALQGVIPGEASKGTGRSPVPLC